MKHVNDLRNKDIETFAGTYHEFRTKFAKTGKVQPHPFTKTLPGGKTVRKGVPQGTPISSFLSNLYMFECDSKICELVESLGGYYRRYSDDLVVLCREGDVQRVVQEVSFIIDNDCGLEVQAAKTQVNVFRSEGSHVKCYLHPMNTEKPFQYLGFDFDGERIRIRSASLAKFYRKMKGAIRRRARLVNRMKAAAGRR